MTCFTTIGSNYDQSLGPFATSPSFNQAMPRQFAFAELHSSWILEQMRIGSAPKQAGVMVNGHQEAISQQI